MNKGAIQRFAIWARTELIAQVSQRAYQYGITKDGYGEQNAVTVGGRALTTDEQRQRKELVEQIRSKGYTQVMEEVAYTWFNRFIALRFMEVNNYPAQPYPCLLRQHRRVQAGNPQRCAASGFAGAGQGQGCRVYREQPDRRPLPLSAADPVQRPERSPAPDV